jgi:nitrogen regulatory protein PII
MPICAFFKQSHASSHIFPPSNFTPRGSNLMVVSRKLYSLSKGTLVKLIIATIKPFKLEEVREAVSEIGVSGMMASEVKGFGAQSGHTETYRGAEYTVNFVPKIKLEIAVKDEMADQVIEAISNAARTGKIGDGKVFVLDLEKALRVRTGESNEEAL